MNAIIHDLRYALRGMRRSPGFALTAIAVLALGLGANIAVFTLVSGILLRPLPYGHADRIVAVEPSGPIPDSNMSYANMLQLRDAMGPRFAFGATLYQGPENASVVGPGGRVQVKLAQVTANLFDVLGVQAAIGRAFRVDENQPGRNFVVLLGDDVWRRLYNADPNIIGKTLTIRRQPYTIIGVLPTGFFFSDFDKMAVWTPAAIAPASRTAMTGKDEIWGWMYARLPEGMTEAQLAANLSRTQAIIAREVPDDKEFPSQIKVTNYRASLSQDARKPLSLVYAVVSAIWLLACLNVTSLMLARAVSRTREQGVRAALGAPRRRLLQQSMVESLLLSGVGAAAGLLCAQAALKLLWRRIQHGLPLTNQVHLDWRVVTCLTALTLVTACIFGIYPALRAMRRDVRESLSGAAATSPPGAQRAREALVAAQLAITLVFLVGAGLFLRTIYALRQVPLGFAQQNVLTGGIILSGTGGNETGDVDHPSVVNNSYLPLLERLRAIPGVRVAALSSVLPLRPEMEVDISTTLDHKDLGYDKQPRADGRIASPGLVEALGIPMIRGRFFTDDDTPSSPPVIVVNQAFANKYLPGQDPIGHTISLAKQGKFADIRIVGVLGDMKQFRVDEATRPEIYFCLAQSGPGTPLYGIATAFIQVAIRAAVPADLLRAQFDKALHEVAPEATTTEIETIHEAVEDSFGSQTLIARLLESFAAIALMISTVGLYGLLSFTVAQRTREIGVRIALGAPQSSILCLVLRRALLLVVVGLSAGAVMAWFAAKLMSGYIYGVSAHDGITFAGVALVLAAASFLAAWLPARRAAAVDPILALRSE